MQAQIKVTTSSVKGEVNLEIKIQKMAYGSLASFNADEGKQEEAIKSK